MRDSNLAMPSLSASAQFLLLKAPEHKAVEPKAIPIVAEAPPLVLTPVEAPRVPRPRGRPRLVKAEAKAEE